MVGQVISGFSHHPIWLRLLKAGSRHSPRQSPLQLMTETGHNPLQLMADSTCNTVQLMADSCCR